MKIDRIEYSKKFQKQVKKLSLKEQNKVVQVIDVFYRNPSARQLRLHELKGQLMGLYSISAGGDLRLHFEFILIGNVARFVAIGTHAQLYK
ncbi:type II toxin-antitoxin system mRNA interferase toxin, RelE/StbE family [Candidatus Saccharibacteria bacterium]|nr:type II toxin-antitoxin system mRNA interferase toxin, RelE/StbE family [Candidatus Saccharibacteria bacterium]